MLHNNSQTYNFVQEYTKTALQHYICKQYYTVTKTKHTKFYKLYICNNTLWYIFSPDEHNIVTLGIQINDTCGIAQPLNVHHKNNPNLMIILPTSTRNTVNIYFTVNKLFESLQPVTEIEATTYTIIIQGTQANELFRANIVLALNRYKEGGYSFMFVNEGYRKR